MAGRRERGSLGGLSSFAQAYHQLNIAFLLNRFIIELHISALSIGGLEFECTHK